MSTQEYIPVYEEDFDIDEYLNGLVYEDATDLDSGTGKYLGVTHKKFGKVLIKSPPIKVVFPLSAFKEGQDPTVSFSLDRNDKQTNKFREFIEKYQLKFREHLKSKKIKEQLKLKKILTDDALDVSFSDLIKVDDEEKYDPTLKSKFKSNSDGEFYCKFFTLNTETWKMEKMAPQKLSDKLLPRWTYINAAFALPGMFIISNNYYPNMQIRQVGRILLPAEESCALDDDVNDTNPKESAQTSNNNADEESSEEESEEDESEAESD